MNSQIQGNIAGLLPPVRTALGKALDALDRAGIHYNLTSGYRSPQEQLNLLDLYHAGAPGVYHPAPVGQSAHQRGTAIDLVFPGAGAQQGRQILGNYGFSFTGGASDPVHYDYTGAGVPARGRGPATAPGRPPGGLATTPGVPGLTPTAQLPWNQGAAPNGGTGLPPLTPVDQLPWNQGMASPGSASGPGAPTLTPTAQLPWNQGLSLTAAP